MSILNDKRFPSIVVDDFFDNPNEVLNIAQQLDYKPADNGMFAGIRTESLHIAAPQLHDYLTNRFMSLFFDFKTNNVGWNATSFFHKITPYNDDKEDWLNKSWIHVDQKALAAGLVYLTPNPDLDSGTSLFKPKDGLMMSLDTTPRIAFHKDGVTEGYAEALKLHNDKFVETVNVKNLFNRMVAYDANVFHAANTYYTGAAERMTLVFFIYSVDGDSLLPLDRIRTMPNISDWK